MEAELTWLLRAREEHRTKPAVVQLIDHCVSLMTLMDAANDEGRQRLGAEVERVADLLRQYIAELRGELGMNTGTN